MPDLHCDILIVGASLGGVAAALSGARMGASVVLVERSEWVGGQLTAQGVCTPDENQWVETIGATASYQEVRRRIRDHYRSRYRLSELGASQAYFNPGNCWVSRISAEPKVGRDILLSMIAEEPGIDLRLRTAVVSLERIDDRVTSACVADAAGNRTTVGFEYVLDATDLGDVLALAGVEFVIGAESRHETGEPDAPDFAQPDWIQPFTFPIVVELRPRGEDHTIPYVSWSIEEMKAIQRYHVLDGAMRGMFGEMGWWTYRRVIAAENFADPSFPYDVAMINTPSNDFRGGVLPTGNDDADARSLAGAQLASLCYLYWLQTECPREDDPGTLGYPEMKMRCDWFDRPFLSISPQPYIRESRRIRALKTITQQDVAAPRPPILGAAKESSGNVLQAGPCAAPFPDSVGIGHYWLDIHAGASPEPERLLETRPFQIPLGALIPRDVENLLPACKNIGTTHLTNGCYRLHPIEWNIGEAAGALAAFCIARGTTPHRLYGNEERVREFQNSLIRAGVRLAWETDLMGENDVQEPSGRL